MKLLILSVFIFCDLFGIASLAFSQVWQPVTNLPNSSWYSISMSPDGTKMVAANASGGFVYTSTNSGAAWITNKLHLGGAGASLDGTKWAIGAGDLGVYYSTNSGITWKPTGNGPANTMFVASSADGNILAANSFSWISTNGGAGWTFQASAPSGFPIILNNGTKRITIKKQSTSPYVSEGICVSVDGGASWTTNSVPSTNLSSAASSADGSQLVAVDLYDPTGSGIYGASPRPLYITTNSGISWFKASAPSNYWLSVASSADGNRLVAAASPTFYSGHQYVGGIYTSTDGGLTWISNSVPSSNWVWVTSSADGSKLAAAVNGGKIYTASSIPTPRLNCINSGGSLKLSWLISSTNLIPQENHDLTSTNWVILTDSPTLNFTNLQEEIAIAPTNGSACFRLISH